MNYSGRKGLSAGGVALSRRVYNVNSGLSLYGLLLKIGSALGRGFIDGGVVALLGVSCVAKRRKQ